MNQVQGGREAASIAIGLGGNLGQPRRAFDQAVQSLQAAGVQIMARSRLYVSRAWGLAGQPDFLNAVILVQTDLDPHALLAQCQRIEREQGRVRHEHWGPRTLDLDLLFYGDQIIDSPALTLPHPYLTQRDFVIEPLAELGAVLPAAFEGCTAAAFLAKIELAQRTVYQSQPWEPSDEGKQ